MPQLTGEMAPNAQQGEVTTPSLPIPREMLLDFTTFSTELKQSKALHERRDVKPPKIPPVAPHYPWQMLEHASDGQTGWEGALFHTRADGVDYYALYHQGANDMEDAHSVRAIYGGEIPSAQMMAAQSAIHRWNGMIAQRQQGKRSVIVDVGYSLGGVVCSLTSDGTRPCVVFDCPSPAMAYDKLEVKDCVRDKNKITVLSPHATYYNANGPHYGHIITAGTKFWDYPQGERVGLRHFVKMSKKAHNINRIGHALAEQDTWDIRPACDVFSGRDARPVTVFQAVQAFVEDSKQHRSRQTFTEKVFAHLVDRQAKKGPEEANQFLAKIAKWAEKSPRFERMMTERVLGKKIAHTPAQSWVDRSANAPVTPPGRSA